ncbi:hypothetical protein AOLI_G00005860 [Acnodon oligacanthus]
MQEAKQPGSNSRYSSVALLQNRRLCSERGLISSHSDAEKELAGKVTEPIKGNAFNPRPDLRDRQINYRTAGQGPTHTLTSTEPQEGEERGRACWRNTARMISHTPGLQGLSNRGKAPSETCFVYLPSIIMTVLSASGRLRCRQRHSFLKS